MLKTDRDVLEVYRTKKLGWRKEAKVGKLSPVLAYGPEETVAYCHYFMPSRWFYYIWIAHCDWICLISIRLLFYFWFDKIYVGEDTETLRAVGRAHTEQM
jgi:hypothetical protein